MWRKVVLLTLILLGSISIPAFTQLSSYQFEAAASAYTPVSNGTVLNLASSSADPLTDEGFANNIPIGFTFYYCGTPYTTIHASTNGFASFNPLSAAHYSNNLAFDQRLALAPFWDDLALSAATGMQYATSGQQGSRVFTLQWSNVLVDFGALTAGLSFQLKLYEGTNRVEFCYNQLTGVVQATSGGASIGLSGSSSGSGSYVSLAGADAVPTASSSVCVNNILARPASSQVYRFTPVSCLAPVLQQVIPSVNGVSFSWSGPADIEYAVSTQNVPPSTANAATSFTGTASGLLPGSTYYLFVRGGCSGTWSNWTSLSFTTQCTSVTLPYTMPISEAIPPFLPACTSVTDENQDGFTWRTYPSAGAGWSGNVIAYSYNPNAVTSASDWLYTAGLPLNAGKTYRLRFKYNNDSSSLYSEQLGVYYGVLPEPGSMVQHLASFPAVANRTPKVATLDFSPPATGTYFLGFKVYSDADQDVLILDDISLAERPACDTPGMVSVQVQATATGASFNWQPPVTGTPSTYEYSVTQSAADPDAGTIISAATVSVPNLLPFTRYYFHLRAVCGSASSAWVTKEFATIANDVPCNALPLTGGVPVCGNTQLATSINDPITDCSNPNNSVWFKYTATENGKVVLKVTTPAAPADPLHGWISWYDLNSPCPNLSIYQIGYCQQFGARGNNDTSFLISPDLVAGNTYYLMVDGFSDDAGAFCITVPPCSPPVNVKLEEVISTRATIAWEGTGSYIVEYGPSGFVPASAGGTVGILLTNVVSPVTIDGLSISTGYDVFVRKNCTASGNGFSTDAQIVSFVTLGPPPANDECAGAIMLTVNPEECSAPLAASTLDATTSHGVPEPECSFFNTGYDDDVWFRFTPAAGQEFVNISFGYVGGNSDLVAQVYRASGNDCSSLTAYACSDDEGEANMPGFFSLPVEAGTTYFIRVYTLNKRVNSDFTICVSKSLLINDNAAGAIGLTVDAPCTGAVYTNVGATQSVGEPTGSCSSVKGYASVWYAFVAPAGGAVRISTAMGSGNTLTNTRVALFSGGNVNNYESFHIIACDEDGGSGAYDQMSVLYATGLTEGWTYYIQVDKYDSLSATGTFCITVETLKPSMISSTNSCNSTYQAPVGNISSYDGWISLMDTESKLVALVNSPSGASPADFGAVQNIVTGAVRKDPVSGEYYLNRSFRLANNGPAVGTLNIQLFYLDTELAALRAVDSAATVSRMRVTRQTGATCQPDFIAANGTNTEINQSSSGSVNGVNWLRFGTTSFSNFYLHSTRSQVKVRAYLQGAFNGVLGRHKDVTVSWANVLNTYARSQPYNIAAFGNYAGTESVAPNFFKSTSDTTDVVDWVLLEVKNSSGTVTSRRAALIREDGWIVDLDGISPVSVYGQRSGNNYITVRHRNHLGLSTQNTHSFGSFSLGVNNTPVVVFDFTAANDDQLYGDSKAYKRIGPVNAMIGGNSNGNSAVSYTGLNNDASQLLASLGGNQSFILNSRYDKADLNLDGIVRFTGLSNDASILLSVLGGNLSLILPEQKR